MKAITGALKTIEEQRKLVFARRRKQARGINTPASQHFQSAVSAESVLPQTASKLFQCQCCNANNLSADAMTRIDSAQLLCGDCFRELRSSVQTS